MDHLQVSRAVRRQCGYHSLLSDRLEVRMSQRKTWNQMMLEWCGSIRAFKAVNKTSLAVVVKECHH